MKHDVWIVPEPPCSMRYINDVHYLPGDEALEAEHVQDVLNNNVEVYQTRSLHGASAFQSPLILVMRTVCINVIKELYCSHCSSYDFND